MKTAQVTLNAAQPGVGKLYGYNFDVSVAAVVNLRNGTVGGDIHAQLNLAADDGKVELWPLPIDFPDTVYVEVVSGTVDSARLYYF